MKENSTLDLSRGLMCESNLDAYLSRNQSVFCDEDVIIFLNQLYQRTDLSKAALDLVPEELKGMILQSFKAMKFIGLM